MPRARTRCDTPLDRDWTAQAPAFFPFEEQPDDGNDKDEDVEIFAGEDEAEDVYPLIDRGAFADIEALIRDTFVDALPLQPLCRPDCKGLCPQCGVDLNEHPEHEHKVADMRFAGLAALKGPRLDGAGARVLPLRGAARRRQRQGRGRGDLRR